MVSHIAPPNGQELLSEFMQYGHQRPFEEIVRRYAGMVFNVCLRVTKDKHDAEDATQAVFLTLAVQVRRGAQIKALGPWLQQVAKRLSLDLRRSKTRRKVREERHQVEKENRFNGNGDALPQADLDEIKIILHEELNKLPSKYRLPLILHYFGGLSRDEMASELGCKPSTLGVRIFRGREMLAGRLRGRGINMSSSMFTVALTYTVHSAVSHAMISTTSHAATALAIGHDGMGLISSRVIGLSRRAASAMALGKVKLTATILILGCSSLGFGAKAFGMLPKIDIQQLISNEVMRLIRPMVQPLTAPLRVDAGPTKSSNTEIAAVPVATPQAVIQTQNWKTAQSPAVAGASTAGLPAIAVSNSEASPLITNFAPSAQDHSRPAAVAETTLHSASPETTPKNTPEDSSVVNASSGGVSGEGGGRSTSAMAAALDLRPPVMLASKVTPAFAYNGMPVLSGAAATDLFVSPATKHTKSTGGTSLAAGGSSGTSQSPVTGADGAVSSGASASAEDSSTNAVAANTPASSGGTNVTNIPAVALTPAVNNDITNDESSSKSSPANPSASDYSTGTTLVRVPAIGGTVINSAGMLSGYGKVNMTGTLDVCGQVVANGQGVDRTLNLTAFANIRDTSIPPAGAPPAGWYAENHGRLILRLQSSADGSTFTWGEDPNDVNLSMVNAVRLTGVQSEAGEKPIELSLLSLDREDLPSLLTLPGVPVGLWEVDPLFGDITSADLSIRYNDDAVAALGDSESSLQLWTMGDGSWQPVDAGSFALDTTDHLISGLATDFRYFAVEAPSGNGADISNLIAVPASQIADDSEAVPEPAGLTTLALAGGLLARRRRRR